MAVNRKLDYYVKTYGEAEGKARFDKAVRIREKKALRAAAGRASDPYATYTAQDVVNGDAITCLECGAHLTRLQWTHFKHKCTGDVRSLAEYRAKYPDVELVARNLLDKAAVTQENMISLYGKEEGQLRWDEYRAKQAYTNSFEHKEAKYGWTRKEFDEYNASRAVTKKNLIAKHGVEKGTAMWESYVERQRHTCSLEYFVEAYGEEAGLAKYRNFAEKRNVTSELEQKFANKLLTLFPGMEKEAFVRLGNTGRICDCFYPTGNKVIELYGDYWHANPAIFSSDTMMDYNLTAQEKWELDAERIKLFRDHGYDVMIVWEKDWREDDASVIDGIRSWLME